MSGDAHGQLAALGRRLGGWEPAWGFALGEVPRTAGWLSPAQIEPGQVGKWLDEQARQLGTGCTVAAAYLDWGLEYRPVNAVIAALLLGPEPLVLDLPGGRREPPSRKVPRRRPPRSCPPCRPLPD